ncbi:glutathione S-transferase [Hypoxylon sp. FL1284]|nr:glutathione S-transferase [Hypoxylon sp. FL1284]
MAEAPNLPIVLYTYGHSPFGRRVEWYMAMRHIPYTQCIQPDMLPRPDLKEKLGVAYRRIPAMSIGRDVYVDSRLMLAKLAQLYPASAAHPALDGGDSASSSHYQFVAALLSRTVTDGGLFMRAASLLPPEAVAARGPGFARDRAELVGVDMAGQADSASPFSPGSVAARRPEAAAAMREVVELLETATALAGGADWLLGTPRPSLADLEAVWPLQWLHRIPGALPADVIGRERFPRVYAWIERFEDVVEEEKRRGSVPRSVEGAEAAAAVVAAPYAEPEVGVDAADPVVVAEGLERGADVRLGPTDWGVSHTDAGPLVGMDKVQFVIETAGSAGSVRLHAPRHGFKVCKASDDASRL